MFSKDYKVTWLALSDYSYILSDSEHSISQTSKNWFKVVVYIKYNNKVIIQSIEKPAKLKKKLYQIVLGKM